MVTTSDGSSKLADIQMLPKQAPESLIFVVFDLMHLDKKDLRPLPCVVRRKRFWKVSAGTGANSAPPPC